MKTLEQRTKPQQADFLLQVDEVMNRNLPLYTHVPATVLPSLAQTRPRGSRIDERTGDARTKAATIEQRPKARMSEMDCVEVAEFEKTKQWAEASNAPGLIASNGQE